MLYLRANLARTGERVVLGSNPAGELRFGTVAIPFTPLCRCLSEETLNAVGPFYLVSMPGEVKYPRVASHLARSDTPNIT